MPVLSDAGTATHDEALSWANAQYDAFTERRRFEAEAEAEAGYLDDLRTSAKTLEAERKRPPDTEKKTRRGRKRKKA